MKILWALFLTLLLGLVVLGLYWLSQMPPSLPARPAGPTTAASVKPLLRVGLVPERDIFAQHKKYRTLAAYLSQRMGGPVELATMNTYQGALRDLAERRIDGAFMGSLAVVLAMDRLDARVLARADALGHDTYRGVIFVPEDSPIRSVRELAGKSVGMVRTTTAGNLFPIWTLGREGLLADASRPRIVWVGTHDDVVTAVMSGQIDAGAVKDRRLDALLEEHLEWKVRRLAQSEPVPEMSLVLHKDAAAQHGQALSDLLLRMHEDPQGLRTLEAFGSRRFMPCRPEEYRPVYDMAEQLGSAWEWIGIGGQPPRRPATQPAAEVERAAP